jgi:hypothetical protein
MISIRLVFVLVYLLLSERKLPLCIFLAIINRRTPIVVSKLTWNKD